MSFACVSTGGEYLCEQVERIDISMRLALGEGGPDAPIEAAQRRAASLVKRAQVVAIKTLCMQ